MAAAEPYARVMEDMAKGREYATQLRALLGDSSSSPEAGRLVDQILHAMSRTIQTARAAAAAEEASEAQSDVTCAATPAAGKRKAAAGGGVDKKGGCRRRGQQSSVVTKSVKDLGDRHSWRKYGQKEIQNCKYPKAYFRCTHKYDQQCKAQRQVQRRDDDPDLYTVTYIGAHTCRDPATAAVAAVHAAAAGDELHAGSRLISFAATATASTTTTTTGNTSSQHEQAAGHSNAGAALLAAAPMKLEGEQEEVLSSLTPAGSSAEAARSAVVAAAAAATPGPDQGDVTSGLQPLQLQLQEHCYGGDLGDMAYDDTFDLVFASITDLYPDVY